MNRERHFKRARLVRGGRWRTINKYEIRKDKNYWKKHSWKNRKLNDKETKQIIKNKKLCKRYPFLIPRNRWTDKVSWLLRPYDHTEWDEMPKGWRKAFGDQLLEDLRDALLKDGGSRALLSFRIEQLKEKYGDLRLYHNYYSPTVSRVINTYEVVSEHVCIQCGKLDTPNVNIYGWWSPVCKECFNERSWNSKEDTYDKCVHASYTTEFWKTEGELQNPFQIPISYTVRSWSKDKGEQENLVDIHETVQKIRWHNRKWRK